MKLQVKPDLNECFRIIDETKFSVKILHDSQNVKHSYDSISYNSMLQFYKLKLYKLQL